MADIENMIAIIACREMPPPAIMAWACFQKHLPLQFVACYK